MAEENRLVGAAGAVSPRARGLLLAAFGMAYGQQGDASMYTVTERIQGQANVYNWFKGLISEGGEFYGHRIAFLADNFHFEKLDSGPNYNSLMFICNGVNNNTDTILMAVQSGFNGIVQYAYTSKGLTVVGIKPGQRFHVAILA